MNCPDEVAQAALEIIQNAILSIRFAAYQKNLDYCALEADHIHNLPGLILNYRREKLEYYLNIERQSYVERLEEMPDTSSEAFTEQWEKLEGFLRTNAA
ncbi:MAG: hypothetical protein QOH63_2696 [Acidobacteriota bacterium]|jgi:hypothetical protein|nr:hypothetical protein [Acidobacteriota bacterium]